MTLANYHCRHHGTSNVPIPLGTALGFIDRTGHYLGNVPSRSGIHANVVVISIRCFFILTLLLLLLLFESQERIEVLPLAFESSQRPIVSFGRSNILQGAHFIGRGVAMYVVSRIHCCGNCRCCGCRGFGFASTFQLVVRSWRRRRRRCQVSLLLKAWLVARFGHFEAFAFCCVIFSCRCFLYQPTASPPPGALVLQTLCVLLCRDERNQRLHHLHPTQHARKSSRSEGTGKATLPAIV